MNWRVAVEGVFAVMLLLVLVVVAPVLFPIYLFIEIKRGERWAKEKAKRDAM